MKAKKYWIMVAVILVYAGTICATNKKYNQVTYLIDKKDTLKGIEGVHIYINFNTPEVEKYGLTKQHFQNDVELRIRQNGIRVFSVEELDSTIGMPVLCVTVSILVVEDLKLASVHTSLGFSELVFLARDSAKYCCVATTWYTSGIGTVGLANIKDVRERVKDQVDEFLNDYLAANPKGRATQ